MTRGQLRVVGITVFVGTFVSVFFMWPSIIASIILVLVFFVFPIFWVLSSSLRYGKLIKRPSKKEDE